MSQNVILDEGGSISVHTRIKDMCKAARNQQGLTNQDIANLIAERFGIEDFSVNTVNNFFSERSKATTIYTTGYICAVLDISIDKVFNIKNELTGEKEAQYLKQISELHTEIREQELTINSLKDKICEKEERLEQAHKSIEHFRSESTRNNKKVQPWVFACTLGLLILVLAAFIAYLFKYDINNPAYGIFRDAYAEKENISMIIIGKLFNL